MSVFMIFEEIYNFVALCRLKSSTNISYDGLPFNSEAYPNNFFTEPESFNHLTFGTSSGSTRNNFVDLHSSILHNTITFNPLQI